MSSKLLAKLKNKESLGESQSNLSNSVDELTSQNYQPKILQNSKIENLQTYKSQSVKDLFTPQKKEMMVIKSMRMNENTVIMLKDYCYDLGKSTGKNIKEQDVIALAITEFIENNPV